MEKTAHNPKEQKLDESIKGKILSFFGEASNVNLSEINFTVSV